MKKRFVAIGLLVLVAVSLLIAVLVKNCSDGKDTQNGSTVAYQNAQLGVTVDNCIRIIGIDEYYGRLAVIAENVSDSDIEYAVLSVKTKTETLTFNVSALLRGTKAVLLCNEDVGSNPGEVYTAWQTKDVLLFEKQPVMNDDKIEVKIANGSISVRNVSGEDIDYDIYVYYKDKKDDLVNGSITYKTRIEGIKADSLTYAKAPELDENNCQIIFTEIK